MADLTEIDSLEILVIVDNEVDPMSTYSNPAIQATGNIVHIGMRSQSEVHDRGDAAKELRMDSICCGAHGLSLMIVRHINYYVISEICLAQQLMPSQTAIKGDKRHTMLFDTGPEEDVWERNVKRLRPEISSIELIHLSHWHRDHSGTKRIASHVSVNFPI